MTWNTTWNHRLCNGELATICNEQIIESLRSERSAPSFTQGWNDLAMREILWSVRKETRFGSFENIKVWSTDNWNEMWLHAVTFSANFSTYCRNSPLSFISDKRILLRLCDRMIAHMNSICMNHMWRQWSGIYRQCSQVELQCYAIMPHFIWSALIIDSIFSNSFFLIS